MHSSVMFWVGKVVESIPGCAEGSTLEVGSAQVNGGVRALFSGEYIGVDIVDAEGVDLVVRPGEPFPFDAGSFDTVVSTEMLEHDERPWKTMADMRRVLRDGGHLILTCRGFDHMGTFPYHDPPDRWRFSEEAMRIMMVDAGFKNGTVQRDPQAQGWFLHGKKTA